MVKDAAIVCGLRRSAIQRREQFRKSASSSPTCRSPVDTNKPSRASSQSRGTGAVGDGLLGDEHTFPSETSFRPHDVGSSDEQETRVAKTHLDIGFVTAFRAHTFLSAQMNRKCIVKSDH